MLTGFETQKIEDVSKYMLTDENIDELINNKLSKIMYKNSILGLYKIMKNLPYFKKFANGIFFTFISQ